MATIVLSVYMVREPLGGVIWWTLQWVAGLHRLGHDVWVIEKATHPYACFDLSSNLMTDDSRYGMKIAAAALERFGLENRISFVDYSGTFHGLSRSAVASALESADVFLDIGNHGAWLEEADRCGVRVLVDGEPGYTQMRMVSDAQRKPASAQYDYYYTNGANVGSANFAGPTAGHTWRHVFNPVMTSALAVERPPIGAPFTTVMNWQSHSHLEFEGRTYRQKDVEFERFIDLPNRVSVSMEVAVAGDNTPTARLASRGWHIRDAHSITTSVDSYLEYIRSSAGEFAVCKHVFVATHAGWFSDRSATYLASGRPVVIEDTGIRNYVPCGEGLFAVDSVDEAAAAIQQIMADYPRHSRAARRVARECLDTGVVLRKFLTEIGV